MKYQGEFLTREVFDRAMKKIEEDAEWELRHPRIEIWHHQDIDKLRKFGFFKKDKAG